MGLNEQEVTETTEPGATAGLSSSANPVTMFHFQKDPHANAGFEQLSIK